MLINIRAMQENTFPFKFLLTQRASYVFKYTRLVNLLLEECANDDRFSKWLDVENVVDELNLRIGITNGLAIILVPSHLSGLFNCWAQFFEPLEIKSCVLKHRILLIAPNHELFIMHFIT